jgi:hypothetical protein
MNDINLSTSVSAPGAPSELGELREQCAELRAQTRNLRVTLLVVAASLAAFFWLEVRRNSQALQSLRPQAAQVLEAAKLQDPAANRFISQLVEYGKAHADFAAVLSNKYGIRATPAPASAGPAPAATTPPAAPKK